MEIEINRAKETRRTKYYQGRHAPVFILLLLLLLLLLVVVVVVFFKTSLKSSHFFVDT